MINNSNSNSKEVNKAIGIMEAEDRLMDTIREKIDVMNLCIKSFGVFTAKNKASFPNAPSTEYKKRGRKPKV
jgi:hypothetical protein